MRTLSTGCTIVRAITVALIACGPTVGQSTAAQIDNHVADAKALYANAAYADALRVLGDAPGPEAQQYRALCLLALGRGAEAQEALDRLVTSTPSYAFSTEDMPPRFIALVTQIKEKRLPAVLRGLLASGREQFQKNAHESARQDFQQLLTLASDPTISKLGDISDLRLLASGFLDVIASLSPPPPSVAEPPPTPVTPPSVYVPPVAITQRVPPWPVNALVSGLPRNVVGLVRLSIGADGRVTSATMERGVHPAYNQNLLAAARNWRYKPATINGIPIESETVVSFRVAP
jgi:TonB family protein